MDKKKENKQVKITNLTKKKMRVGSSEQAIKKLYGPGTTFLDIIEPLS